MSDRLDEALERAERSAAFITVTAERSRREAPGPLVAWKDLFDVAGTRTTNGSATRRAAPVATDDAPMLIVSPYSRFRRLWCVIQRSATSARVSPCAVAAASIDASAAKYASFQ